MNFDRLINQIIVLDPHNLTHNVWGGNWILKWKGHTAPDPKPVGESWEVSCHPHRPSRVTLPDQSQHALRALLDAVPALTGGTGLIPFLFKIIDARDNLSIQVHPSDAYARQHENDNGKAESWVILDTGPAADDGFIYVGFKNESVSKEAFKKEIRDPNGDVLQYLNKVKVKAGDIFDLKPGWIHAIGKGVRIAEIQQNSNVTYRVWDWNRKTPGRPLHVEKAMDVLDFNAKDPCRVSPARVAATADGSFVEDVLVKNQAAGYALNRIELKGKGKTCSLPTQGRYFTLTVMSGELTINAGENVSQGQTLFVPSTLDAAHITCQSDAADLFKCAVP